MSMLNSMEAVLTPTGIYNIEQGSLVYAELSAYAVGLDLLDEELNTIERECFICTAETYGLLMREHLVGALRDTLSIESRREMLLSHGKVSQSAFTKERIEGALISCGMIASISEYPSECRVYINCVEILDTTLTQEQIKNEVSEYIPPHLEVVFDFRKFNWSIVESKSMTFGQMDNKNMTWSDIDIYEEE